MWHAVFEQIGGSSGNADPSRYPPPDATNNQRPPGKCHSDDDGLIPAHKPHLQTKNGRVVPVVG